MNFGGSWEGDRERDQEKEREKVRIEEKQERHRKKGRDAIYLRRTLTKTFINIYFYLSTLFSRQVP